MKKLLLIAPNVFGLISPLVERYESLGFSVDLYDDRHRQGFIKNFILRFARPFYFLLFSNFVSVRARALAIEYDKVVVINGEGFDCRDLISIFEKSTVTSFYTWDSVSNKPYLASFFLKLKNHVNFIGSFDFIDSEKFDVTYRPLFGIRAVNFPDKKFQFSFIGTMHSGRLKFVASYVRHVNPLSSDFLCVLFCKNLVIYIFYMVLNIFSLSAFFRFVRVGSVSLVEFEDILMSSDYVLDYCHPNQSGLTHRSIMALVNNKSVVSNNTQLKFGSGIRVGEEDFFLLSSDLCDVSEFTLDRWVDVV